MCVDRSGIDRAIEPVAGSAGPAELGDAICLILERSTTSYLATDTLRRDA
jgi:hypothetical protein